MQNTFRSLFHEAPSRASRGARLSLRTCESPLQPPTGALLPAALVSMADGAGDPVGAGGTDGAASDGGAHMATSSPAGIACLTIKDSRDLVMEDSQEPEGTARELGRQARTEQKDALTKLIAQAPEGYARQRVMRAIARLVKPELRVSILHGSLLWPGRQISSNQAARAVGAFSRNPYKDAWSRLDPGEYGF